MTDRPTIGLDLGGTKVLGLAMASDGRVLGEARTPTPLGGEAILDALASTATTLMADTPDVAGVGAGAPGLVDRSGVLRVAPNLPDVFDLDVRAGLEARLPGVAVRVDNDASCAGIGEFTWGAAKGSDSAILVTLGTGIGGAIITGEGLYRGTNGFAGEIGHVVVDPHGPRCVCGQRGCWERYASGSGLARMGREAADAGTGRRTVALAGGDPQAVRGEHVVAAAREGDAEALAVMDRFGWWLALGLANLANIFDPQVFVVGGGLVEAGDIILGPARAHFAHLVEGAGHRPPIAIVPAHLGERAGAIGAAVLASQP